MAPQLRNRLELFAVRAVLLQCITTFLVRAFVVTGWAPRRGNEPLVHKSKTLCIACAGHLRVVQLNAWAHTPVLDLYLGTRQVTCKRGQQTGVS